MGAASPCAGVSAPAGCCVPVFRVAALRAGKMGTGEFQVGRITQHEGGIVVFFPWLRHTDDLFSVA